MSKGNIIQGQATGKLGDTVLMVRNGKQVARVYTTAGARSGKEASEAARIQRVKFGSASNQWALYRYVSTRMYRKGRKSNQSDYNYFVKRNASLLPYFTKEENASGVHVLMPGQFSEGNMGRIELLYTFTGAPSEETPVMLVADTNSKIGDHVSWTSNMSVLKSSLRQSYPSARKITYLISIAREVTLTETGTRFLSQNVSHFAVIIDLYNEVAAGENNQTVKQYFSAHVNDTALKNIINAQTAGLVGNGTLFVLRSNVEAEVATIGRVGVLIFATDDNAGDCYTTTLPETAVPPTTGAYSLWSSYRTAESLRIAADSYGFQAGVMRDEVASWGNDLTQAVSMYVARLAKYDAEVAAAYSKTLEAAGGAKARTVRKTVSPTEDE